MQNKNSLKNAYKSIELLKSKSIESLEKNFLTPSELSRHSGISRNNLSKDYIKKYPKWAKVRKEIDDFELEFKKLQNLKKISPEVIDLTLKLDNSYKQNIELIYELKEIRDNEINSSRKIDVLRKEKEELDIKLKEYIDKFGLI